MLAYLFLSKVATLTQSNLLSAIFPYVHFGLTTGQEHGIAVIAGIAIFARLWRLNVITSWRVDGALTGKMVESLVLPHMAVSGMYLPYIYIPESTWKILWTWLDMVV